MACVYGTVGSQERGVEEMRTPTPRKPSRVSGPGTRCAPRLRLRCLRRPGSRKRTRPFSPPGPAQHRSPALPLVGRRDGLPADRRAVAVRKRVARRTASDRGGVVVLMASAFHRASNGCPWWTERARRGRRRPDPQAREERARMVRESFALSSSRKSSIFGRQRVRTSRARRGLSSCLSSCYQRRTRRHYSLSP